MKHRYLLFGVVSILLLLLVPPIQAGDGGSSGTGEPNPEPPAVNKPDESDVATPNLSFPTIHTDIINMFYEKECIDLNNDGICTEDEWFVLFDDDGNPIPIDVEEVTQEVYTGTNAEIDGVYVSEYVLDPTTGCPLLDDNLEPIVTETPLITYLNANDPWYPQPTTIINPDCIGDPNLIWDADCVQASNSWQADWYMEDSEVIYVDFVDWGDVLEMVPEWPIGLRVPIDVTLYERTGDPYADPPWGESMTAYNTALLEYQGGPDELFGVSELDEGDFTSEIYLATVVTDNFIAEVCPPTGPCERIKLVPTMNPNGRLNIKASGRGFWPEMVGIHRIWIHFNDPHLTLWGAEINNLSNYVLETGCRAKEMDWIPAMSTGIVGDSAFVDFYVVEEHSGDPPPQPPHPGGKP